MGEPGAVAVDELAEGVFAVGEVVGVLGGVAGDAGEKLRVHLGERLGRLPARLCELRVGLLPGFEFGDPLPLLERDLIDEFGEQLARLHLERDHVAQQAGGFVRVGIDRGIRSRRHGVRRDVELGKHRRSVLHDRGLLGAESAAGRHFPDHVS